MKKGKVYEKTGIEYVRKSIEINCVKVEIVVPNRPSTFDIQIPDNLLKESNSK